MIGEDISALANSATLNDRDYAYMIWGIDDCTHEIIWAHPTNPVEGRADANPKLLLNDT